ncbi:hypothetical protein ACT8ZV_03280 [Nocardioides sp. MAHUQ-72]|uniref:hypothetical protein n=1 Tax=unclassified Nocardioides TaxID=2615069 RepID=UPI00360E4A58
MRSEGQGDAEDADASWPAGVLHAQLHRAAMSEDGSLRAITGLLVLADDAPTSLEPRLTLGGSPLDVTWRRPSPRTAGRFAGVAGADGAGFVATGLDPAGGPVELSVHDASTGERVVLARRRVRRPGAAAQRLLASVRERLAQESARPADERDPAAYDDLRALLDEVPAGARQDRWQRLALEVDGVFLQRARRAFRQMRELSEAHVAEGTSDEFEAWFTGYRRLIHPRTLGYFGYWTALDSRDEAWVWDSVGRATRAVAALGHEAFVVSGTLLGLAREGGLVAHDADVDMAVLLHADSLDGLAVEWAQLRGRLEEAGILQTDYVNTGKRLYKLSLPGGFGCDLFPAWEIDGRVSIWPHTFEVDPTSVLPLGSREVCGVEVRVPRVPEDVLTCNYGPDWRTPDPLFKFDWAGAKERFAAFIAHTAPATGDAVDDDEDETDDLGAPARADLP